MPQFDAIDRSARPCVDAAYARARLDVMDAIIPAYAERFPVQVEETVNTVAGYRLKHQRCCQEDLALA